jgi:hypothetical protein
VVFPTVRLWRFTVQPGGMSYRGEYNLATCPRHLGGLFESELKGRQGRVQIAVVVAGPDVQSIVASPISVMRL